MKWMPPEAIVSRVFSQKSDVWSYGIVLGEIFTLGEDPFNDISLSPEDFVKWLLSGPNVVRPTAAPIAM